MDYVFITLRCLPQQLADESQVRIELQMALDSKDSDIEQLRSLLTSLNVHSLDSASMSSGPEMDTDESLAGTEFCSILNMCIFLRSSQGPTFFSLFHSSFFTHFPLFFVCIHVTLFMPAQFRSYSQCNS